MWQEVKQMAQRAINRLNNVLCRGVLSKVTQANRPTALVTLFNEEKYDNIEFAQDWGFISYPPEDNNTELLVAFLGGQRDQGTVLKSFNRKMSLKGNSNITLIEGETALYNKVSGNYLHFKQDGSILLQHNVTGTFFKMNVDGSITISSTSKSVTIDTPSVVMTGNLTVDGDILDNATGAYINTNKVRDMRTIYDGHVHGGVAVGAANTAVTTQTM